MSAGVGNKKNGLVHLVQANEETNQLQEIKRLINEATSALKTELQGTTMLNKANRHKSRAPSNRSPTDGPTGGPTDGPTDQATDKAAYRVAFTRLKRLNNIRAVTGHYISSQGTRKCLVMLAALVGKDQTV